MLDWINGSVILWMLVIIASVAIEAVTLDLSALWFAVGGVAALLLASFGVKMLPQLIVFTVVSALLLLLVRPAAHKLLKPKGARTNADRIIGEEAFVTVTIDNAAAQGEIRLMGQIWSARSANGAIIPQGEKVRVLEIVGVKAIVELVEKEK
jgi:membrane protein implicated in regulation of membrane protease activity